MTHDELIEAVAKAIFACHFADTAEAQAMMQKAWNRPSPLMTMVHNEARAAIRVIAPAVLEEAALSCDAEAVDCRNEWNRNLGVEDVMADVADDCADAIRAMKTRYEQ